jgi:hypothetical protein
MPAVLETVFIGQHREHALQSFVSEFDHLPTPLADQMLVIGIGGNRFVSFESFTELMGADQSALHQEIQRPVYGGQADLLPPLLELAPDPFHGGVVVGEKYDLSYQVSLAG